MQILNQLCKYFEKKPLLSLYNICLAKNIGILIIIILVISTQTHSHRIPIIFTHSLVSNITSEINKLVKSFRSYLAVYIKITTIFSSLPSNCTFQLAKYVYIKTFFVLFVEVAKGWGKCIIINK